MTIHKPDPAFMSRQLRHNVKIFAKIKGCRLQDVEKAVGVSVGYFARCEQSSSFTGIDILCALSEFFSVPIEDLITDAYEKRIKAAKAKAALSDAISQAQETLSKEEIIRIVRGEI